ncbi:MAG: hypothetical protein HC851_17060 [Acaryochloris sp. RU_4_1]|nr:hypothetical protein [Acaryochloris sp. SU_5_25]NJM67256.1 hypothetical protein [Acaryochloris sp. RU_4_1]NJR56186.1 hypothetical protein [Acaryochloris sp. CRU_2_0]
MAKSECPQSQAYFVTLCTHQRECLFGEIVEGQMQLNSLGALVAEEWQKSFETSADIDLHHWVIMPNHIHGIVTTVEEQDRVLPEPSEQDQTPLQSSRSDPKSSSHDLRDWINTFKKMATERINPLRALPQQPLWQREFDQHFIPHRFAFHTFHQYINTNPHAWDWDKLHPDSPACS